MITINGDTISGNYTNGSISITTKGDNVYINGDLVHTTNDKTSQLLSKVMLKRYVQHQVVSMSMEMSLMA